MNTRPTLPIVRRSPKQRRSRQTVEAVLDAVIRILKRDGIDGVTTNHIAEVAGVSIGSVYQYFPDKRAIFSALHDRHVEEMSRLIESTLVSHAASSLEDLMRALVSALVGAHARDPELYDLLTTEVPQGPEATRGFETRLRGAFRLAITSRTGQRRTERELERMLFVLPSMVESLAHAAAVRRPQRLSTAVAIEEAVRAVLAYLGTYAVGNKPHRD